MPNIIVLANHARASAGSRAANEVSNSAVTRAERARSVPSTAAHHSEGIFLRCHHLETTHAWAPTSAAIASREGQMSITALNDVICDMANHIGQTVLKSKVNPSLDCGRLLGHTVRMADSDAEAQFKQEFTRRVKEARIARGWKQWQAGAALGIPQDQFKQYEGRSLMPHHMIGLFCLVTRVDHEWLLTGRGKRPVKQLEIVETAPEAIAKPKRARTSKVA